MIVEEVVGLGRTIICWVMALFLTCMGGIMSGLTVGYMSIDEESLKIKMQTEGLVF